MNSNRYPLANDLDGNPMELPPEAAAWRVRRRSGKQGRPQCVYDHETGAQLELTLDSTIDDLRDYGPGVYRLDAIDANGKVIPNVIAQTEVPVMPRQEPENEYGSGSESAALIKSLVDSNVRAMNAMASAFGPVSPVHAMPQTPIVIPSSPGENVSAKDWAQLIPQIVQAVQATVAAFSGAAQAATEATGGKVS